MTTIEEIEEAVANSTKADKSEFVVKSLRPAFGGRKNATVIMRAELVDQFLQNKTIKIGWTQCILMERKTKEIYCLRCWERGHNKSSCRCVSRENLCMKCTKEGHRAVECPNRPFCLNCGIEGHQTTSFKCQSESLKSQEKEEVIAKSNGEVSPNKHKP